MDPPEHKPGKYATDLLVNLSMTWIDDAIKKNAPFFLAINPVNPHNNYDWNNGNQKWTPPVPAERHKNDFPHAKVPRSPSNFNPDKVNVPLVIRGPQIPKGKTVDFVTSHIDIAPTVVNWAGAKGPGDFDGNAIPVDGTPGTEEPLEHVQVEHWGKVSDKDSVPKELKGKINTYIVVSVARMVEYRQI
ncbi:hypothetical protein N7462_001452 [Penicillium macrosclerotiorum]|uniref:uncharacterized protein n=1 Tax=Penicillium macrosclerotiorum TaxID=303699 RepID=UPI002547B827|nr:uncharacterized protein N7462_001452 [Penicillium macrosclerotiorum]KAJ5692029.1 hypothetical protein N7462_001452 [Penicillium macrosclerotiorum]